MERLRQLPFEDLGFARVDHHRQLRKGFPEVIFCPGKTTEQIIRIFESLASRGNNVLATRAKAETFAALASTGKFPNARYDELGRTIALEVRAQGGAGDQAPAPPPRLTPEQVKADRLRRLMEQEPLLGRAVQEWDLEEV